jgi:hypothetical protein
MRLLIYHHVKAQTYGVSMLLLADPHSSMFFLSLNLAAILKTCVFISVPLHSSRWNRQRFYRIGEVRLLNYQHLKAQTYGVSIGQELVLADPHLQYVCVCVCGGGGGGGGVGLPTIYVRYLLLYFYTLYMTRSRAYKIV